MSDLVFQVYPTHPEKIISGEIVWGDGKDGFILAIGPRGEIVDQVKIGASSLLCRFEFNRVARSPGLRFYDRVAELDRILDEANGGPE